MNYVCEDCGEVFDKWQQKANHVRWQHLDNELTDVQKLKRAESSRLQNEIKFGKYITENITCCKCDNQIEVKYREGKKKEHYYCCRACANSRGSRSDEFKSLVGKKIKDKWNDGHYDESSARNHLKLPKQFSSKTEREIVKYFKEHYPNDNWTHGGGLKFSGVQLSRDLYSNKLKICVEYDGIWHFKDIHGQLDRKQLKDKLLEQWCKENDYRLIRIDEEAYKSITQLIEAVYNSTDQLMKIGVRYK